MSNWLPEETFEANIKIVYDDERIRQYGQLEVPRFEEWLGKTIDADLVPEDWDAFEETFIDTEKATADRINVSYKACEGLNLDEGTDLKKIIEDLRHLLATCAYGKDKLSGGEIEPALDAAWKVIKP